MEELKSILRVITSETDRRKHDFSYPVTSLKDGYLKTFKDRMELYISRIDDLNIDSYIDTMPNKQNNANTLSNEIYVKKQLIKTLSNQIVEIIEEYLSGKSKEAYQKFSEMIDDYRPYLEVLSYKYSAESKFYRMRKSHTIKEERKDMFHISFGERHLVSSQRYSIAGVPNLYLGNTSYVCWLELEKPNLDDIYISTFSNQEELNILDFALTFDVLLSDNNNISKEKILAFFTLFPLIFACSFKKQNNDAKFNIEYVIPNKILQWLSTEKAHFDGIRYFSTKMTHDSLNSKGINIVLPPKENTKSLERNVYCSKLKRIFKLTKPAHWSLLTSLQNSTLSIPSSPSVSYENIEQAFDNNHIYLSSEFGQNEEKLEWLEKDFLNL